MAHEIRCPECGGPDVQPAQAGERRCVTCGATLVYRTAWIPILVTWALVGAVIGLLSNLVFAALELQWGQTARMLVFGALTGVVATLLSRRFRTLGRA
jgi:hypothetical protein